MRSAASPRSSLQTKPERGELQSSRILSPVTAGDLVQSSQASRPATVASTSVFRARDYVLFVLITSVNLTAIAFLLAHWVSLESWTSQPLVLGGVTLLAAIPLAMHQARWFLLPLMKRPIPSAPHPGWRVAVATTFVPGSEPLDMLEATVQALVALDYPHDTWVLDEGDDDAVKEVCRKYGALHFSRKHFPRYQKDKGTYCRRTKYGNYNAWLTEIGFDRYDILTAFDPDHLPERHFLTQVLGYFDDPHVGYVQAAQAYGNQHQSWIARGAAEETYDYFSTIQMASYGMGYPVIVGGHNTHRMAALREVGGFAAHDADDILITLLYRDAGWRGVYVPQILARGQTPSEWPAYLIQQRRWARSVLDIKLRTYPSLAGRAPLPTRAISFVHGFNYLARGLLPALVLGLLCVLCISNTALQALAGVSALPVLAALATLTLSELFRQRFFLDPRREWGLHWRAAVLRWARWPQMILALQDVILDRHPPYSITAKSKGGTAGFAWLWPHLMAAVIVIAFWGVGVVKGEITHPAAHLLVAGVLVSTLAMCTSGCLALCVFARRIRTVFRL